jgi:hypothetical protein
MGSSGLRLGLGLSLAFFLPFPGLAFSSVALFGFFGLLLMVPVDRRVWPWRSGILPCLMVVLFTWGSCVEWCTSTPPEL